MENKILKEIASNQEIESSQISGCSDLAGEKDSKLKVSVSIKSFLSISIIFLILFIALSFYIFFLRLHKKMMDRYIRSKAKFAAYMLSIESLSHIKNNEIEYIREHVKNITTDQDVLYAAVLDATGKLIADSAQDQSFRPARIDIQKIPLTDLIIAPFLNSIGKQIGYEALLPITSQNELVGLSRVFLSLSGIKKNLSLLKTEIFIVVSFVGLIGILIAFFISGFISRPILDLVKISEKISSGNFNFNIPISAYNEIGLLTQSFNKMIKSIQQYQDKIVNQSNELKAVINSMGSGLFTIDKEWRITSFNKAAERITGYKEKDVLGKKCEEVFHSDVCPKECPLEKALQIDTCFLSNDFYIKNKDGRKIPVTASTSPLKDESGQIIGGVEVFKDLTELKELQKQLVQADKMAALGQMVSGIAHDINNPTGVIHSNMIALAEYIEVIKDLLMKYRNLPQKISVEKMSTPKSLFSEIKDYEEHSNIDYILEDLDCLVDESKEAARRITQIVKDLRDFIHTDVGQLELADLNQRLDASLKLIKFESDLKIKKEYSKLPLIYCNIHQIDQVFTNIILNAVQALGSKGEIRIKTSHKDNRVMVSVRDNGPGIPEDIQPKIFDPFFTTKEVGEGTGLGLSICFKIVASHGGKIWVQSEYEKGTEFFIELPVNPQQDIIVSKI